MTLVLLVLTLALLLWLAVLHTAGPDQTSRGWPFAIVEQPASSEPPALAQNHSYDEIGRVTSVTLPTSTVSYANVAGDVIVWAGVLGAVYAIGEFVAKRRQK